MNQQPVAQLGLEPGGLRRHDAAGVGDRHQVVDRDREHRERDRRRCRSRRPARAPRCRARRRRSRSACRCGRRRCRAAARARAAAAARRRASWRASRPAGVAPDRSSAYQRPSRYIDDFAPCAAALAGRRVTGNALAQRRQELLRRAAREILDHAVVRQDLHLVVGKRDGDEGVRVGRGADLPSAARRGPAPALAARWWPSAM